MRSDNVIAEHPDHPEAGDAVGRSGETVERVAAELKAGIFDGRFAPGQRLISRDVVEQLGVSRSSLREAFRRLEADGLVDVIPNRGAVVRTLTPTEVRHVYQIREALEGYAAQHAARRIDESDNRARLTGVLKQGRVHRKRPIFQDFIVDNRAFHQEIVRICGNPSMSELIDKYQLPVFMIQLRRIISVEQMICNSLDEHEDIADAILAADPVGAYDAMKRHLWHSAELILALPAMNRY